MDAACWALGRDGPLKGRRVAVTAGGTREPLDPIRFVGNRSSGKMGHSLVRAARDRGAEVTLISTAEAPALCGTKLVAVETAAEMHQAVLEALPETDILLMAAAVADYRPVRVARQKIKKSEGGLILELERTVDILAEVASLRRAGQVVVGFAAETEDLIENARAKLARKRLDLIVANDARLAMGATDSQVTLVGPEGRVEPLPLMSKDGVAASVLDWIIRHGGLAPTRGQEEHD